MSDDIGTGLLFWGGFIAVAFGLVGNVGRPPSSGIAEARVEVCAVDTTVQAMVEDRTVDFTDCTETHLGMAEFWISAEAQKVWVRFREDSVGRPPPMELGCHVVDVDNWSCAMPDDVSIFSWGIWSRDGKIDLSGVTHLRQLGFWDYWSSWVDAYWRG